MSTPNEDDFLAEQAVRMASLLHKRREKEPMTEAEQQELDEWLANHEPFSHDQIANEVEVLKQYDEDAAVLAIFKEIGLKAPTVVHKTRIITRRWLAAASVLLLTGVASWLLIQRNGEGASSIVNNQPGSKKAVLTLADGKQVMLDSNQTIDLGMQGTAKVNQQPGARLSYNDAGDGATVNNTLTTPRGVQYSVQLADGSEVWLNAASSITYPTSFKGNTREVTITGEAYFTVAKDKSKPFFVTARGMKVEVVGTAFNVMAYEDEEATRVTLVEGIVKASTGPSNEITLQPGEQATALNQQGVLRKEKANLDAATAWRLGQFSFYETDMTAIIRQIARWYDIKVEYKGSLANITFTGQISRKQRVEDVLDILSDTRKVHYEIKDDKTVVIIPGKK